MSLADKPAFPFTEGAHIEPGISVRELFAGMIMAATYANPGLTASNSAACAAWAVSGADALIAALEEDETNVSDR